MRLGNQVCNKDLAKRIEKLGVPQDSLWYWVGSQILSKDNGLRLANTVDMPLQEYSAFTVAELGDILKDYSGNVEYDGKFKKWKIIYFESSYTTEIIGSEADARAKLLIYLLENKLLDKPKLKED